MDSRSPRDGRALEEVGIYHPISPEGQQLELQEDRIREWLSKGARPSATVKKLLNKQNITVK
jgi:small subunit ribosomal protein S16